MTTKVGTLCEILDEVYNLGDDDVKNKLRTTWDLLREIALLEDVSNNDEIADIHHIYQD